MANNKVQLSNGTVVIDLSSDTVTSASHIKSGLVGHLADGTTATGTLAEKDVKSVTYNLSGGVTASISTSEVVTGQGFSVKLKAPAGYGLSGVTVTMGGTDITNQVFAPDEAGGGGEPNLQTKSVSYTPTTSAQSETVTPDSGYDGMSSVSVSVGEIPSEYIVPSGTKSITQNGTAIDVTQYASVDVAVPTSGAKYATGSYTPASTYNTTGNMAITTIANIGFTPSKFLLAVKDLSDVSGTQYAILRTSYESIGDPEHYTRLYTRYSNTSGTLGQAGNITNWTSQTDGYLYLSNGTIYYRTVRNCILVGGVEYVWYAYE